jgi:hypothetical protein
MKKILFTPLFIFVLFVCNSFGQEAGEKKGWPSSERYAFISECIKEAKVSLSEDSARFYCYCMQERVEKKYPTIEEAAKITEADMQSEAWQKDIKSCLGGFWGTAEREEFLSNCISSAQKGEISGEKAKTYCECMLYKIEIEFPNPVDAGNLTPEKLSSPEWKKIIQGCLDF